MKRFRDTYHAQPLHALAAIASFALVAAGFAGWITPGSDARGIITWFLGCLIGSQLLLVALSWLLDRIAFGPSTRRRQPRPGRESAANYILVPALLSALLLVIFLPLILRLGSSTFADASGLLPTGYLAHWLFAAAGLFGSSALAYALKLARTRRTQDAAPNP